jgi:hypothetical protein
VSLARVTEVAPAALDYRDAARFLGVSESSLRRGAKDGSVRSVHVLGRRVFRIADLREFLNNQANEQRDAAKAT